MAEQIISTARDPKDSRPLEINLFDLEDEITALLRGASALRFIGESSDSVENEIIVWAADKIHADAKRLKEKWEKLLRPVTTASPEGRP